MAEDTNGDGARVDTPDSAPSPATQQSAKRKRTGNVSSRGVANLTPEQLARKRANDREAQRAIRERTKSQIERLNQRIRELESAQPFHDLQVVLRQKEALQAELDDIKRRLSSIMTIIQPILGTQGLHELAAAAERSPHLHPPTAPSPLAVQHQLPSEPLPYNPSVTRENTQDPRNMQASYPALSADLQQQLSQEHGDQISGDPERTTRAWALPPGAAPTSNVRNWLGETSQYEQQQKLHQNQDVGYTQSDERLGVDFLLEGSQRRNGASQHESSSEHLAPPAVNYDLHQTPPYAMLPKSTGPTCPLDSLLLDFLAERHAQFAQGVPLKTVVGPTYPNFSALVFPNRRFDSHPTSKVFTDILRTFPDISRLPEQVAIVFIMFLFMRWQIDPTQENYDRLPDWIQPKPSQLVVPHPAWMDHIPWPKLRDHIILKQPFQAFDSFFIPFTTTISVNWPYEAHDCLLPAPAKRRGSISTASSNLSVASPFSTAAHVGSPQTPGAATSTPGNTTVVNPEDQNWLINPAFESHLRNLNNWSLGPNFRNSLPHLAEYVRLKD